jgi:CubicO group peptidase (beta-lactamase class C family)
MRLKMIAAAMAGLLTFGLAASAQVPSETKPKAQVDAPQLPVTPTPAPALTKQDVDGWLDGFLPYALSSGDIAGATVVVVKDGQILTQKGYGFADIKSGRKVDPEKTLFRPGSVSKLFVWTAVMQQVEQGKIDLDADINKYLDFKIAPYQGKPVTMRNLMTHTPGFEEWAKSLFVGTPDRLMPLGKLLARWQPKRIYAPGTTPAYSNYGASLAGYIVERVSGQPFDDYMDQHIFAPLDMQNSTFRQPLPKKYEANMATAYQQASQPPKAYELVAGEPAGSSSMTATDIAHFMIAHLNGGLYNGKALLRPETVVQMHAEQPELIPPLKGMALGFYHEDRNGHSIIGHGGDTSYFHSDLSLFEHDNVGLFISMNSAGKERATSRIRASLLRDFTDRYFPAAKTVLPTAATAKEHAQQVAGRYWFNRRADTTFMSAMNLMGQTKVVANPDGTIKVEALKDFGGGVKTWREVGPYVWKDADNDSTLAAVVKDGKVQQMMSSDIPLVMALQPVPGWASAAWNLPLFYAMCAIFLLTLVLWPVQVLVRRRYGRSFPLKGREAMLYRLTRGVVALDLIALGTWTLLVSKLDNEHVDGSMDGLLRIAQVLTALGAVAALVALWNAFVTVTGSTRGWWGKTSAVLIALACVAFVWFVSAFHLLSFSLFY